MLLNIQSSMIGLVDSLGDFGRTDAVANLTNKRVRTIPTRSAKAPMLAVCIMSNS